jgi:hypothetical protein
LAPRVTEALFLCRMLYGAASLFRFDEADGFLVDQERDAATDAARRMP